MDFYEIEMSVLTFVRGGEDSWGFKVASTEGAFHLKIYSSADESLLKRLHACRTLQTALGTDSVVTAVPTRTGTLTFQIDEFVCALFPYVLGTPLRESEWTDQQAAGVGMLLARIHAASLDVPLPAEQFSTTAADAAQDILDALPSALRSQDPAHRSTARLLLPSEPALRREVEQLRRASEYMRQATIPFVICHGDPTWDNILFGAKPYLIDWDDMVYAPKERDLVFFADPGSPVLEAYRQAGGTADLDTDALMYYRALWNNEGIADFGRRLLFQTHSAAQTQHDLAQLENFLIYSGLDARAN